MTNNNSGMEVHKPEIFTDGGPWAQHDMACAVCHENKAVLRLDNYSFLPCWECQKKGWQLIHSPALMKFLKLIGAFK